MTRSTPAATSALRLLASLALVAAVVVLAASLLTGTVSAAPRDDIVGTGDEPGVVVDDPTQTPLPEVDPALTPVAIPSVSPEPTRDPFDVTGDLPEEVALPDGPSDLHFTFEVCNPPVPGQIADLWCGPDASGYEGQVYAGTQSTYTEYYFGPLPVDLIDIPAGPYLVAGEPAAPLTRLTLICRVEDGFGNLITTLTGKGGAINLSIGHELVYRCTMYQLPEGELPDEIQRTDGPVELIITDLSCPPGTDPALNFFGLIGRCSERNSAKRWVAQTAAGGYVPGEVTEQGVARFALHGDTWTVSNKFPSSSYPPVLYCNVRDELLQEPPAYAPFMTYTHGQNGAVIALEQYLTWNCVSYTIPMATGTGADVAQVSVTKRVCPEGIQAPTVAACGGTLPGVTFHLLYAAQTIVATRQTDANGAVAFAAPENLQVFGLAEEVPAGYRVASNASCSVNGAAPTNLAVDQLGIVDLGTLTGGDTVSCDWFNIVDPGAAAAGSLELETLPAGAIDTLPTGVDADAVATDDATTDDATADDAEGEVDGGRDQPQVDGGEDVTATGTPESGIVPLEEDE